MSFKDKLDSIMATTDHDTLAKVVVDMVEELVPLQGENDTMSIRNFMLSHNTPIELRIESALKHLGTKLEVQPESKFDFSKGVAFGYYGTNNSAGAVAHLIVGVPNLSGVLITVVIDRVLGTTLIHKAVGTLIAAHAKAQIDHDGLSDVVQVSTHKKIMVLYSNLDKLMRDALINEPEEDPFDNPAYTNAVYKGYWEQGLTLKQIQAKYIADNKPADTPPVTPTP